MKITSVKVRKICKSKFKASISLVVDGVLFVDRINVIYDNQRDKLFLSMPNIVKSSGKCQDIFFPINRESREMIETLLIEFYEYTNKTPNKLIEMVLKKECWDTCIWQQSLADFKEKNDEITNVGENETIFSITSFRIHTVDSAASLCAIASFIIDYSFAISNLKIILDKYTNEYKLIMPQYETKVHTRKDIIHPVNREFRSKLEEILLGSYRLLSNKNKNELNATILEGKNKSLHLQKIIDFSYEYGEKPIISKESKFIDKNYIVTDMTESFEEKIYGDSGYIINEIIRKDNRNYISGKIVGYIDDNYYKVVLTNGEFGIIECKLMDIPDKVVEYKNQIFSKFIFYDNEKSEEFFLKHVNCNYYFEITGETLSKEHLLSIENVKIDYLHYIVEHECILQGRIIQINNGYVGIEIPFGYIFFTSIKFVFGCTFDSMFDYESYLGVEISVIIHYDEDSNKIYPMIANRLFNLFRTNLMYIFPTLTIWEKTYYSALWLDRSLLLIDKQKKYPLKNINQLVVVGNIREKGEIKKLYKGNIRKIFSPTEASVYRERILAVGWIINLTGHNIGKAVDYLNRKGFPYTIQYAYSLNKENGIVISMQPDVEDKMILPKNVIIQLVVSQGKRKEYIMPNFIGMNIKDVHDILKNNKIGLKYEISNIKQETIRNNCVIETWPRAGMMTLSGKNVSVKIYQKKSYESPFALRENEDIILNNNTKIVGSESMINQYISIKWQKEILVFILKHKIANSIHLKWWINMNFDLIQPDIDWNLKFLKAFSMIGAFTVGDDMFKTKLQFFFPNKNLYILFKSFVEYNGIFSIYGKDARYCKTRAAENQAFLRLYNILKDDCIIKYEVDCIQSFIYDGLQKLLRVHIAVNANNISKKRTDIYFIEAIRFINEDQIMEGWDKLLRYNMYINRKYDIIPYLILVFEDETHYKEFMMRRPDEFKIQYIKLLYTWDSLTNKNSNIYENVFMEDNLC